MAITSPASVHANSVKSAIISTSTCTASTVTNLQQLLSNASSSPTQTAKENSKGKVAKLTTTGAGRRAPAAARTTKSRTKTAVIEVHEDADASLTPREKFILATEVVNASLKSLTDALKPQPKAHRRISSQITRSPKKSQDGQSCASPQGARNVSRTVSGAPRPPMSRSVSQLSNASTRQPFLRRSSSYSSTKQGPAPGIVATAECARSAFAYLRTSQAERVAGKDLPPLQIENGMVALIGKMIAHGLESMAIKELRILKRRLETSMSSGTKVEGHNVKAGTANKAAGIQAEKETLASLLHFSVIEPTNPALSLVHAHQMHVLKIMATTRRPAAIEAALEFLQLSCKSSPANVVLELSKKPGCEVRAARQLESFAQSLLSLCPSIANAEDASACDRKTAISPEAAFRLQHLAFEVRLIWWRLSGHRCDAEKDLLEPFSKCLGALSRRSVQSHTQSYTVASEIWTTFKLSFETSVGRNAMSSEPPSAWSSIYKSLSTLAQTSGLISAALEWMEATMALYVQANASEAKLAACKVRLAVLSLEGPAQPNTVHSLDQAISSLSNSLKGDASDLDALLAEIVGLRKVLMRRLLGSLDTSQTIDDPEPLSESSQDVRLAVAAVHYFARYVGACPLESEDPKILGRYGERVALASKVGKGFVDLTVLCCKIMVNHKQVRWEDFDNLLQDCLHVAKALEAASLKSDCNQQAYQDMTPSFVRISNSYWAFYVHRKKKADCSDATAFRSLQRSVDVLRKRSISEQRSGLLAVKLEKLGATYESSKHYDEASAAFTEAVEIHIRAGTLRDAVSSAGILPLRDLWQQSDSIALLGRTLQALNRSDLKSGTSESSNPNFTDDVVMTTEERGMLLEWQLVLLSEQLVRTKLMHGMLTSKARKLVQELLQIYDTSTFPLRRKRVMALATRLETEIGGVLTDELTALASADANTYSQALGLDSDFQSYQLHLQAMLKVCLAFLDIRPSLEKLRELLQTWQTIIDEADSWAQLAARIDDFDMWISQIRSMSDYFSMRGEGFLRVPTLKIITRALELQQPFSVADLVKSLTELGLQYLELGYSGKAGLTLAKAQNLLNDPALSTEAKLQWHLAYAQYLLAIGNPGKCGESLRLAEDVAKSDADFMDIVKPAKPRSGRLMLNRLIAETSYVSCQLEMERGSPDEALVHARRYVNLNRRMWASLENDSRNRQRPNTAENSDTAMETLSEGMANLQVASRSGPVVLSMTHAALTGASFWSFVPCLFRGLSLLSEVLARQGLLQDSVYYADQAHKVAGAVGSDALTMINSCGTADLWTESGQPDKSAECLKTANAISRGFTKSKELVLYYRSRGRTHRVLGEAEDELANYNGAEETLEHLSSSQFVQGLDRLMSMEDSLTEQLSKVSLGCTASTGNPTRTVKGRKAPNKVSAKSNRKQPAGKGANSTLSSSDECTPLASLQGDILRRRAAALLLQDRLGTAVELIDQAESFQKRHESIIQQQIARFQSLISQAMKEMAADFTFNVLPESTISFPALARSDRKMSEPFNNKAAVLSPMQKSIVRATSPRKGGRGRNALKEDFVTTLRKARDCIAEVQIIVLQSSSTWVVHQVCGALSYITLLLSAAAPAGHGGILHPLSGAYYIDVPKIHALEREKAAIKIEKQLVPHEALFEWPSLANDDATSGTLSLSEYQRDYIDIIPESWTALSLSINEAHDELYITRYHAGQSPFILRLPLSRHRSDGMDEDVFGFEEGKAELLQIIELSNFSTHDARDMNVRGAKTEWWAEREALDARLRDLLINIENIWLGGLRGIFSQHIRQPNLLARFQKSFENILNRHLPSRQGRAPVKKVTLDPRILELFVGLGDANDEEIDFDEPLLDLLYFVVDILQFNGERNAYDEIDFDSITVETLDALRAYHSSTAPTAPNPPHTILILDKNLHAFPWESLPSLVGLSISRLPSLAALRSRILAAQATHTPTGYKGHYVPRTGGTSVLNPSGDLVDTQSTIRPRLQTLPSDWTHHIGQAAHPTEQIFTTAITTSPLLLYFGHGSGAQYVRPRSVKKLLPSSEDKKTGCATAWLMGCSSAAVAEHGAFEPSGMVLAYLLAGAPAVVGTLWDVTDKDCDRAAVRAGEEWGLWPSMEVGGEKKGPKKGAAVEKARGARAGKKGRDIDGAVEAAATKGRVAAGERLDGRKVSLVEAVTKSRDACYLRYLNGAALVVYGIPVYLD